MGKTYIHKAKARFHNKVDSWDETDESYKKYCDRKNFKKGMMKDLRNKKRYNYNRESE